MPKFRSQKGTRRSFIRDQHGNTTGVPHEIATFVDTTHAEKQNWRSIPDDYYFRSPARRMSALCALLVVHALTRLHQGSIVRASDMSGMLNNEYGQISWDQTSIGRFLSELAEGAEEYTKGSDDYYIQRTPFRRHRDGHGFYYLFNGGEMTARWLHAVLHELEPVAEKERDDVTFRANRGTFGASSITPFWDAMTRVKEKCWAQGGPGSIDTVYEGWVRDAR